jgi:hypothetical protein
MAKAFDCAPEKNALATLWSPRLERHRRASTRLSLVRLRPRNPDSVSPGRVTIREQCYRFRDSASLREVYAQLIRHAIDQFGSDDVLRFLGRRTNSRFNGEVSPICVGACNCRVPRMGAT